MSDLTTVFLVLFMVACGFVLVRLQLHLGKQVSTLPPDARKRMGIGFGVMLAIVLVGITIMYLVSPHA
jgi:hypothetical protein